MGISQEKPLLVDTCGGFSVKWRDRFLYSSRRPVQSAENAAQRTELDPDTIYLIPSPLLGYGMAKLKEKLPENSFLLGVEKYQELMAVTQPHLPENLIEEDKCIILRTDGSPALLRLIENMGLERFRRCRLLHLSGGGRLDPGFYGKLEEDINRLIFTYWQSRASFMKMGPLWFSNIFRNLPVFADARSIDSLNVEGTVMLCGAGESLEESFPFIRKMRANLFLAAVDTAYPALLAQEIVPDAVFNLDGQFYNYLDFFSHRGDKLYLFSDITAYPASLTLPGVSNVFFSSQFAPNDLLKRLELSSLLPYSLPPLGSVGVTALSLCSRMGKGPIIFTGLDFSYKPGKSHARGTIYHDLFLRTSTRLNPDGGLIELSLRRPAHWIEGVLSGRKLRSDTVLEGYHRQFIEEVSLMPSRDFYVFQRDMPSLGTQVMNDEEMMQMVTHNGTVRVTNEISVKKSVLLDDFLEQERYFLEKIISHWEAYMKNGDKETSASLRLALDKCDYLTLPLNGNGTSPVYFSEAVKSARHYINLIGMSETKGL